MPELPIKKESELNDQNKVVSLFRYIQELNKSLASLIYDSISSELSEPVTVARSMAHDSFLIGALKDEADTGTPFRRMLACQGP